MATNENSNAPVMCTASCGFYGNPETGGMCSKCARDAANKSAASTPAPAASSVTPSPRRNLLASPNPAPAFSLNTPLPATPVSPAAPTAPAKAATAGPDAAADAPKDDDGPPVRKIQKKKHRCWTCKTKVSLVEQEINKCICGYIFCTKHRHAEEHACDGDFQTSARALIAKRNEKMVTDKLQDRI